MIKPIDEIPKNLAEERKSYRNRVRSDIQEAINNGIYKFEFVGDYNFKTLASIAREEASRVVWSIIIDWSKNNPQYDKRYKYWRSGSWGANDRLGLIKISSVKGETPEKRRVFCEIKQNIDSIIKDYAENECKKYEERRKTRRIVNETDN